MRICDGCGAEKNKVKFYAYRNGVLQRVCKACTKRRMAVRYVMKREEIKVKVASYQARHPEKTRKWATDYRRKNPEKHREKCALYNRKYPERRRVTNENWRMRNLDRYVAYYSARKAAKLKATPKWADHFLIYEVYHLAALRNKLTGIRWEVDHIVPLQSLEVCGLHVEHNLRVIPKSMNRSKNNKIWPQQAGFDNSVPFC